MQLISPYLASSFSYMLGQTLLSSFEKNIAFLRLVFFYLEQKRMRGHSKTSLRHASYVPSKIPNLAMIYNKTW